VPDAPPPATGLPAVDLGSTVVVMIADRAATTAGDHSLLVGLVARLTGVADASVALTQLCPRCGATDHGALRITLAGPAVGSPVHVSLARAGGLLAVAVTRAGPVGIDLEAVADLARNPVADVMLSAAEAAGWAALGRPPTPVELAVLWTAKEAVLKAAGLGLRVDPRDLTMVLEPAADSEAGILGGGRLAAWPRSPFDVRTVRLLPVSAPPGTVATVAVVSSGPAPALHRVER